MTDDREPWWRANWFELALLALLAVAVLVRLLRA